MKLLTLSLAAAALCLASAADISAWQKQSSGPYSSREGLMGVSYKGSIYISAGRSFFGVKFESDVWKSDDEGVTWIKVAEGQFPGRAYHVHLVQDGCQFIMGGQTFTKFYNDVWKSCDDSGKVWELVTDNAPWPARAGLSATVTSAGEMIVAGGCYDTRNRSFWGDVWASKDQGATWELRTKQAEWIARSGPRLIEDKNGRLLIVAGEIGFTPETQLVDIWGSTDGGKTWSLVAAKPGFSERSGHGVVVYQGEIYVIAGWPHLHDLWVSSDNGATFTQTSNKVWNCEKDGCGKFDFWPLIHNDKLFTFGGSGAYSTFGKLFDETWVAAFAEPQ